MEEVVLPEATICEEKGTKISQELIDAMACVPLLKTRENDLLNSCVFRKVNLHAMRLGPGKHLKGLELMKGVVTPEEVCMIRRFLSSDQSWAVRLLLRADYYNRNWSYYNWLAWFCRW